MNPGTSYTAALGRRNDAGCDAPVAVWVSPDGVPSGRLPAALTRLLDERDRDRRHAPAIRYGLRAVLHRGARGAWHRWPA